MRRVMIAVLAIAAAAVFAAMFANTVNTALPTAWLGLLQLIVPVLPAAGVVQVQPATFAIDTKRTEAGKRSFQVTFDAASVPELVTVTVYEKLAPPATGVGVEAVLVSDTSPATKTFGVRKTTSGSWSDRRFGEAALLRSTSGKSALM